MISLIQLTAIAAVGTIAGSLGGNDSGFLKPVKTIFVDNAYSATPVAFCLVTRGKKQYVAYYDANRQMTVACRELDSNKWTYQRLDDYIGWDSHNSVTFAFDSKGYIHLSGNMHAVPLRYYRTTKPEDITTFVRVESMTGDGESHVTYPRFIAGPKGELLFSYRDGGSGNGNEIVNCYDVSTGKWARYIPKLLFDGKGERNAYYAGPIKDSRGFYNIAWVWRDNPDCTTNHDVSYAKSPNYRDGFQKSDGTPVELPLTLANSEVIDPAPTGSGLLELGLSLDSHDRVMITYLKRDDKDKTQIYTARREQSGWKIYRTTDWTDRWDPSGVGAIPRMIQSSPPQPWKRGKLFQTFRNKYLGDSLQIRFMDEATLKQTGKAVQLYPAEYTQPAEMHTEDWRVNIQTFGLETLKRDRRMWALRWESAGQNRDLPRQCAPPPSRLEVVEMTVCEGE